MKSLFRGGALIGAATALVLIPASVAAADRPAGSPAHPGIGQGVPSVFVQTDNPDGNQVIVLAQHHDGRLSEDAAVSTGGLGGIAAGSAADHLASQGSLTYDAEHQLLFAVNAGSGTISVLSVQQRRVRLDQVLSSGGEFPNSIAVHGNLVYIVNSGGTGSVSGFRIFGHHMVAIPGSTRSLGLANTNPPSFLDAPGQVAFSPDGSELLVTTKAASNSIDVFEVGPRGLLSTAPTVNADGTNVRFSFASTPSGQLVVAEPGPSALHTFSFGPNGTLTSLSASVSDGQSALCWLETTGVAATTDAGSIDLTASANGKYLYAEAGIAGAVDEFHINSDGSLSPLGDVAGLGAGIEGIAAD